jgi:hypothetical protein
MQASRYASCHLWIHLYFKDSHLKILDSRVKFSKICNLRVGGYTYARHLFNQLGEKALNDFMLEYLVLELSTWQIHH